MHDTYTYLQNLALIKESNYSNLPKTRIFLFEGSLLLLLFCTSAKIEDLYKRRQLKIK